MNQYVNDLGPSEDLRKRVSLAVRDHVELPITIGSKRMLRIDQLKKWPRSGDIEIVAVDTLSNRVILLNLPNQTGSRASAEILHRVAF